MFLEKRFKIIQISLLVLGLFLAWFYAQHQILTGDQTQMLYKGYMGAYKHVWINYGNAASAVGNVPGSMISYVVALPVMLYDSPMSPMLFLIFLHLASYFLLDSVLKDIYKTDVRLIFLVLYWLNPWFLFENILYNPSYLFFFSALHIWTAYKQREKSSFVYSFLHVTAIGLALQFHYSWIILALISLYLLYRNMVKVNWYGVFFGTLVIGISLVPYLLTVMQNSAIIHHADDTGRYIGWGGVHVYPVLKSFIYWLRYGSFFFPNKLIASAHFDWLGASHFVQMIFVYGYKALVFSVGAFTIYISYKANRYFYTLVKEKLFTRHQPIETKQEWLLLYVFGALVGVFVSSVLSPIIFSYWHLIIVFPFAILPVVIYLKEYGQKYMTKILIFIMLYFTFINIMGALDSRKYSINTNYIQDTEAYIKKSVIQ
ncbi:3-deoxy-D-manno-octulosonic acid transferase [Sulfurimonas sp. NW9]|uniref:3-deoxy-D-manno-octulosonic acid transferase n=1 Tax=Sulfurimonas sp. NW9 TaxID=2922728 RepID=UPI003DA9ED70